MNDYAVLLHPAANRVYTESAPVLLCRELAVLAATAMAGRITDIRRTEIAGVLYVRFRGPRYSAAELRMLSMLSSRYALYEVVGAALYPLALPHIDLLPSDLLSILKYSGKTNEHFTKLLLNVTVLGTDRPEAFGADPVRVLDPLCGRGTTLNQALMYGYDASGMDIDGKDFDEYAKFLKTWLRQGRYKHTATVAPVRRDKKQLGRRFEAAFALDKERFKAGELIRAQMINADTTACVDFYPPGHFDVLVTDAPYGVKHGSRASGALSRHPTELLDSALPRWRSVLRVGGALGISFNANVCSREELGQLLTRHGFEPEVGPTYQGFAHRVDQAILRDLLVAQRPR
ncbi:MAG: TRM11 family SAM-dependent methyltransferase [Sciscionella sp.]